MDTEQDNHRGSCVSCGFLSKHALYRGANPIPLPRSYEIDRAERMLGRAFEHTPYRMGNNVKTDLACYRNAAELAGEVQAYMTSTETTDLDAARHVITRNRHCAQWYRYTEGLSPQQHLDQLKTEELDAKRQELQRELMAMSQKVQQDSRLIAETQRRDLQQELLALSQTFEQTSSLMVETQRQELQRELLAMSQKFEQGSKSIAEAQRREFQQEFLAISEKFERDSRSIAAAGRQEIQNEFLAISQKLKQDSRLIAEAQHQEIQQELLAMGQKFEQRNKLIADTTLAIAASNKESANRIRFWVVLLAVLQFLMVCALALLLTIRASH